MSKSQPVTLSNNERDSRVLKIYEQLVEIEERLIPTGLHVFGKPSLNKERADLLRVVASFDRPEVDARSLTALIAESRTTIDRESCDSLISDAVNVFVEKGIEPAVAQLQSQAGVSPEDSRPMFTLLDRIISDLDKNQELDSVVRALQGEYIEPGPGADIVQNPAILPTGRNTHAINPYSVPSITAFARAETVANALLQRYVEEHGRYPYSMALVLWGLDNIKTQGEGVAQALWLLGVQPVRDRLNRVTAVRAIPLEELERPRIDVVMTVSGIFRDLFSPTVQLLDKAVRLVASLDEPLESNYVRRHVLEQMKADACELDDAAVRVFSNAPGNYGTNVNFMVLDSQWAKEDSLGDLFVTRKCFAYGRDSQGRTIDGREARAAMDRALSYVEATYQNIDTIEVGITDVDHYFEYLGGVSRAVETRTSSKPAIYLSDSLTRATKIRTLEETVALETRAKTLNPKWYEGMLKHGFRGVAEIESHVSNTFGWSATADAVDDWVYSEVAKTFVLDEQMLERLSTLNPHSAHSLIGRLLEAHSRGYWDADDEVIDKLRKLYGSLEDRIEGVA
jgi:magnesium chelatase subunit H